MDEVCPGDRGLRAVQFPRHQWGQPEAQAHAAGPPGRDMGGQDAGRADGRRVRKWLLGCIYSGVSMCAVGVATAPGRRDHPTRRAGEMGSLQYTPSFQQQQQCG